MSGVGVGGSFGLSWLSNSISSGVCRLIIPHAQLAVEIFMYHHMNVAFFVIFLLSLTSSLGFKSHMVRVARPRARLCLPGKECSKIFSSTESNNILCEGMTSKSQMKQNTGQKKELKEFVSLMTGVGATGGGQSHNGRAELHKTGATRKYTDPQMWTHVFFVLAGVLAFQRSMWDLLLLLTVVTPMSLLYHRTYEKPGFLAKAEGISAKVLFVYGTMQIFAAPTMTLKLIEFSFFLATVGVFVYTNLHNDLYDPWHCLMHVVPSAWSAVVAVTHVPLCANPFSVIRGVISA